ncbi:MAG: hypothetical protein GTO24_00840 [candidate division Zixibacteria bacterium]|nr:hypothetical protein [candidate division Zixibacteria bacterium]
MNEILQTALEYEKKGFSVIPVKPNKKPYIKWEEFQKRRATPEEIRAWWKRRPNAMIGVVTGKVSGVSHIDVDTKEGDEKIQDYIPDTLLTPCYATPGGGKQMMFQTPDPPLPNNTRLVPGCDFRGEGGYAVVPPSNNGKGKYQWLPGLSLAEVEPSALPDAYLSFISSLAVGGV